jgi:signal peptidase I
MPTGYDPPRFSGISIDAFELTLYTGPSMNPTLWSLDRLKVISYGHRRIRCGDVVVFCPPGSDHKVAHRVVSIDHREIKTRGDNSINVDEWVLNFDNIIGYVTYAQRGKKRVCIYGGLIGRMLAFVLRLFLVFKIRLYFRSRPAYLRLARSGFFRRCFPDRLKTRVVSFKRPSGIELQLLMGKRVIGSRPPGESCWKIRPPFRLFIDETSLPV